MDIQQIEQRIKGLQAQTRKDLEALGSGLGIKSKEEFYTKLGEAFLRKLDSLSSVDISQREPLAVSMFQAEHVAKASTGATVDIEIVMLDTDSRRATTGREEIQSASIMVPEDKKAYTLIAKGAERLAILDKIKPGYSYGLKGVGKQANKGTIWLNETTVVEKERIAEITEALVLNCFKKVTLDEVTGLVEKSGRDTTLLCSLVTVARIGSETEAGSYHTCFDEKMIPDLGKNFSGWSLWVPKKLGRFNAGSKLLVAYRAYSGKGSNANDMPKGHALVLIPKLVAPAPADAPAGALPVSSDKVPSAFEL